MPDILLGYNKWTEEIIFESSYNFIFEEALESSQKINNLQE